MLKVKYIGNDTKHSENGKVHERNGNHTACGARIDDNPEDWVSTTESVNCQKRGCK